METVINNNKSKNQIKGGESSQDNTSETVSNGKLPALKYPIYKVSMQWMDEKSTLPHGRIWNCMSYSAMQKTEMTREEMNNFLIESWNKYKEDKLKDKNPSTPILSIDFVEFETWCLQWFSHYTFDVGQTDAEVLKSFEDFVSRKESLSEKEYCLMGADDRWRWKGTDGKDAPCRCEGCKKFNIIRINH